MNRWNLCLENDVDFVSPMEHIANKIMKVNIILNLNFMSFLIQGLSYISKNVYISRAAKSLYRRYRQYREAINYREKKGRKQGDDEMGWFLFKEMLDVAYNCGTGNQFFLCSLVHS